MQKFNNKVKEIADMILNKTLESNEVSNMEVNLTPVYEETRQAEIVFGRDNRVVRIELSGVKEMFGTITIEIENYSYGFGLEELEKVLENLDQLKGKTKEEIEALRNKEIAESNERFEKELLKDWE